MHENVERRRVVLLSFKYQTVLLRSSIPIRVKQMVRTLSARIDYSPMTMKSTLIVPITLLATLAAGVLVHDRLRTKPSFEDAAPTRTGSIATAHPDAPAPVSPAPVRPRHRCGRSVEDAAPTQTGSIATAHPAAPAPVSPPPDSAPAPATPEPEPPRRMTASQEASLDAG